MRRLLFLPLMMLMGLFLKGQVAINTDGSSPHNSAILDVSSTFKGLLFPRMSKAERDLITGPATGLMVYQTDNIPGFYVYDGASWKHIGPLIHSINDLADGKSGGYSVFLGSGAGINDDASNNYNVALGVDALKTNTNGSSNTALGSSALFNNTTGINNTASGAASLFSNTVGYSNAAYGYNSLALNDSGYRNTANGVDAAYYNLNGHDNVAMGWRSLYYNFNGHQNIAIGNESSFWNSSGNNNTIIGTDADYWNSSGSDNTIIGFFAGAGSTYNTKTGCVFLGNMAGYSEYGNNKLYIENSSTNNPLIYGEFDNDILRINGLAEIKNTNTSFGGSLKFYEPAIYGSNSTVIRADAQVADITYTLPFAQGSNGQVLKNTGGGCLCHEFIRGIQYRNGCFGFIYESGRE